MSINIQSLPTVVVRGLIDKPFLLLQFQVNCKNEQELCSTLRFYLFANFAINITPFTIF